MAPILPQITNRFYQILAKASTDTAVQGRPHNLQHYTQFSSAENGGKVSHPGGNSKEGNRREHVFTRLQTYPERGERQLGNGHFLLGCACKQTHVTHVSVKTLAISQTTGS